uniref:Nitrogenase iron-molybdenum cofactor biosynthesis protein NifN n=1 Tax=Magnetococcus massalia (strain MO-1) TaxID=451514 RepID=A0A1S7LFK5_MAGMO|nr:Nitrogenase iron-molybdenum cofactor biosynthesis protein nifN [Candidatus Magnetococcus massalia]
MATLIKRKKALAVEPAKASQPVGATLAFMGIDGSIPMLHGSQGCTAFAKVFFVRHFREPIPLQTTAMDQVSTVMGGDDNIIEGLNVLCGNSQTRVVGLVTTGLTECQGSDIHRIVQQFRSRYPEHAETEVVAVNTPDFSGALESGYGRAVGAFIREWVPEKRLGVLERDAKRINVLAGPNLTPGDIEGLKDILRDFDLRPVVMPDISISLDGHLADSDFSPVTTGGATIEDFKTAGEAHATLVIGSGMKISAEQLKARTGVEDHYFESLMGAASMDRLLMLLSKLSGQPVPARYTHQRRQYQDALLDTHFFLTRRRAAIAGDPEMLLAWKPLLDECGLQAPAVVTSMGSQELADSNYDRIKIGDLEDLQDIALESEVDIFIGNSHVAELAERTHRPMLRAGYPLYDWIGAQSRCWIGYQGSRQALFDLANGLMHREKHGLEPYVSIYKQPVNDTAAAEEALSHGSYPASAARG